MKHELQTRNGNDLFDVFDDFFKPLFSDEVELRTDIRENENDYTLDLALPGYAKNEIEVRLDSGYLTVTAEHAKKEGGKYLRKEIAERVSRSYYVGEDITKEDIKAKYENGILCLTLPKTAPDRPRANNFIPIE